MGQMVSQSFQDWEPTYRMLHAVRTSNKKLLDFCTRTLLPEDIGDIVPILQEVLGSNTKYNGYFSADERIKLLNEPHTSWDGNLHSKILHLACGLASKDDDCWRAPRGLECLTYDINGDEPLEFFISLCVHKRNTLVHDDNTTITYDELDGLLSKLELLAESMMTALEDRAGATGIVFNMAEKEATLATVRDIIEDAKGYH